MGPRFLADTNVVIDFLDGRLSQSAADWLRSANLARHVAMSVVTRIELLSYAGEAREILRIERFIQATIVLALDEPVIIETIRLRRQHKRKLPDTIIAATALVHQLTALTRNIADFRTIPGLTVVNLHEPASLPAL